jgi:transcriptional antiterminator RfaH
MNTNHRSRWFVVQTHPNAESKAAAHIARQGFETYLPRYRKLRRHARKVETVAAPLFPRYLFVAIDRQSQRWRCIQSTVGVTSLVCNGDEPAAAPDTVIDELRKREGEDGFVQMSMRPTFARGDNISLRIGAFADCPAQFDGLTDNERVAVLLDLLGRKVRVVVDPLVVAAA